MAVLSILAVFIAVIGVSYGQGCDCYQGMMCPDVAWAKYHAPTNLYWAWASPCSGSCSKLPDPLPYGWRYATPDEFRDRPMQSAFFGQPDDPRIGQIRDPDICAAWVFDPVHDHCDHGDFLSGYVVSEPNNHLYETLLVHDCDLQSTPEPICKDECTPELCDGAASGQRECTASGGLEVDPFGCGGHKCPKLKCTDCGTVDECIDACVAYKVRKEIKGPPNCRDECEAAGARMGSDDWVCFQRCQFGDQPICREVCSKSYCLEKGENQLCSAQDMLVDPKGEADDCGTSKCSHCGAQGQCVSLCENYNLRSGDNLNCAAECASKPGYKCFNEYTNPNP